LGFGVVDAGLVGVDVVGSAAAVVKVVVGCHGYLSLCFDSAEVGLGEVVAEWELVEFGSLGEGEDSDFAFASAQ